MSDIDRIIQETVGSAEEGPKEMAFGGAFEGASRYDRQLALWSPALQSADADLLHEREQIEARSQDMIRNDAYVSAGAQLHKDSIVGHAYLFNSKPNLIALGMKGEDEWATEFQEEVEAKFGLAAESPENWLDTGRSTGLTGMVRLAIGTYCASGEVLAIAEWHRKNALRPFRTSVHQIDSARLRTPWTFGDRRNIRNGVHKSELGEPLGYYIYKNHPNDYRTHSLRTMNALDYQYVRARRQLGISHSRLNVIHIFEAGRPDQSRGVSDLVTGLKELKVLKSFRGIQLQNAVVNSMFAAAIESELPTETVMAQMGAQMSSGSNADAVTDYAANFLGAINEYAAGSKHMALDGVKIPHLFPGTKLNMMPAGKGAAVGQDFEKSLIRYLAASLGVSYEQISRDYTETNYSSARAAMNETWKFMMGRKRMVADRYANAIFRLWFEEQVNAGNIETMNARAAPNMYDGMNFDAYTQGEWIGASRGQIDELKETQAAVLRMKYKISTLEEEQARLGKDWRAGLKQSKREQELMDELGLTTEESNAINAASGSVRESDDVDSDGEVVNEQDTDTDE